jgi:hypothetical protein
VNEKSGEVVPDRGQEIPTAHTTPRGIQIPKELKDVARRLKVKVVLEIVRPQEHHGKMIKVGK